MRRILNEIKTFSNSARRKSPETSRVLGKRLPNRQKVRERWTCNYSGGKGGEMSCKREVSECRRGRKWCSYSTVEKEKNGAHPYQEVRTLGGEGRIQPYLLVGRRGAAQRLKGSKCPGLRWEKVSLLCALEGKTACYRRRIGLKAEGRGDGLFYLSKERGRV